MAFKDQKIQDYLNLFQLNIIVPSFVSELLLNDKDLDHLNHID